MRPLDTSDPRNADITISEITCAALSSGPGSASYPLSNAGTTATGTCASGWYGTPKLTCGNDGVWATTASPGCTRTPIFTFSICAHEIPRAIIAEYVCSAQTIGTAMFPATNSLTTATGTCVSGYGGSPQSECSAAGTWGPVTAPCVGTPRVRLGVFVLTVPFCSVELRGSGGCGAFCHLAADGARCDRYRHVQCGLQRRTDAPVLGRRLVIHRHWQLHPCDNFKGN